MDKMKQKTAMMELIEAIDELIKDDSGKYIDTDIFSIRNKSQQLLEKEKEQIIEAYDCGNYDGTYISDHYYNEKYIQEGKL